MEQSYSIRRISRCIVTIAVMLVSVIGCKTIPRSEEKGLEIAARSKHLGSVAEVFGRTYHEIVDVYALLRLRDVLKDAIDDGNLGALKKVIKEGGKLGDAASISYYRVFKKKRDEFVEEVVFRMIPLFLRLRRLLSRQLIFP